MARPAKLSRTEIVDRVLPVFWRHGLEGTTLDLLEAATGLGRQSLYHQFEDKADLYRATLLRYEALSDELLTALRPPQDDLTCIPRFFRRARAAMAQVGCRVCLAASVAAGAPSDDEHRLLAQRTVRRVLQEFEALAVRWRERGLIRSDLSPAQVAEMLWATGNGASLLAAVAGDEAADQTVQHLMNSLRPAA